MGNSAATSQGVDSKEILGFERELTPGSVKKAMAGASSRDLWQVHPSKIRILEGFNPRVKTKAWEDHIEALKTSIVENGYYLDKPLAGYAGRENGEEVIFLTDGQSRLTATLKAIEEGFEIASIPVVVKDRGTSMEDLTVALVQSNSGKKFTPYELAIVCKRLMGFGWDVKDVAKRLGFTAPYVSDLLLIVGASRSIRESVQNEEISVANAVAMIKKHGEQAGAVVSEAVSAAKESGKTKASAKHLPGFAKNKFVKKHGAELFGIAREIKEKVDLDVLGEEMKEKFLSLLQAFEEASDSVPSTSEQSEADETDGSDLTDVVGTELDETKESESASV